MSALTAEDGTLAAFDTGRITKNSARDAYKALHAAAVEAFDAAEAAYWRLASEDEHATLAAFADADSRVTAHSVYIMAMASADDSYDAAYAMAYKTTESE